MLLFLKILILYLSYDTHEWSPEKWSIFKSHMNQWDKSRLIIDQKKIRIRQFPNVLDNFFHQLQQFLICSTQNGTLQVVFNLWLVYNNCSKSWETLKKLITTHPKLRTPNHVITFQILATSLDLWLIAMFLSHITAICNVLFWGWGWGDFSSRKQKTSTEKAELKTEWFT